jgi:hypothetical protein
LPSSAETVAIDYLSNICFSEEEVRLAVSRIISRAVYPTSELETVQWIRENSAVCELTGYPIESSLKYRRKKKKLKITWLPYNYY